MSAPTTRRGALGILATGPIAMLPALAVMQCSAKAEASHIDGGRWARAYAHYKPIHDRWHEIFEEADQFPLGSEAREKANRAAREYYDFASEEREAFMLIPAPSIKAVIAKMEIADACDDDHHELCLSDLRAIALREA